VTGPAGREVALQRSTVAVICPFFGSREEGLETIERLVRISTRDGDLLVLVDNTPDRTLASLADSKDGVLIVPATDEQGSYFARNVGVEAVESEWLLFIDSDCIPSPTILDAYFSEPIPPTCGAVAGAVTGVALQPTLVARYSRARRALEQARFVREDRPFAATANLLVRREAFVAVGGFHECIQSGGDVDFCWRLQDANWTLIYREPAAVEHPYRESFGPLLRQCVRYGAGRAWLERRHPDAPRAPRYLALLLAAPLLILGNVVAGRKEKAGFRALDASMVVGSTIGRLRDNRPARPSGVGTSSRATAVLVVGILDQSALDVLAGLEQGGNHVSVEAGGRASRFPASSLRGRDVVYLEDDGVLRRVRDLVWLFARQPRATLKQALFRKDGGLSRLWRAASPARRIAERAVVTIYAPANEHQATSDARRLAELLGAQLELLTDPIDAPGR
jgi:GT2 family glycosyltransferase